MKTKILKSLICFLSAAMVMSSVVYANKLETSINNDDMVLYTFEKKSDLDDSNMLLDDITTTTFKTDGADVFYTKGAYDSNGAVGVHVESGVGSGVPSKGIKNIGIIPGEKYEISMDIKLLSPNSFKVLPKLHMFFHLDGNPLYNDAECNDLYAQSNIGAYYLIRDCALSDDSKISNEWYHFSKTISVGNNLTSGTTTKYIKSGEKANMQLVLRLGNSPHGLYESNFTSDFINSCDKLANGNPNLWMEYAIDNIRIVKKSDESFSVSNLRLANSSNNLFVISWESNPNKDVIGKTAINVYDYNNGGTPILLAATTSDELGKAYIKPTTNMIGKRLMFGVVPYDENGNFGTEQTIVADDTLNIIADSKIEMNSNQTSVDWKVSLVSNSQVGNSCIFVAGYDDLGKLVSVEKNNVSYTTNESNVYGNTTINDDVEEVEIFVWDDNCKPISKSERFKLNAVSDKPFKDDDEINVVFLGGSITLGTGASAPSNCYSNKVGEWLKEQYGSKLNYYNEGVGGTPSDFGYLRLAKDVISHNPDLVFVEFAVNDMGLDNRANLEGIVRTLSSLENPPYIVFLYTSNSTYTVPQYRHRQIADYYGILQIDLQSALKLATGGENAKDTGYLVDDVHPSDKGYTVYTNEIIKCLSTGRFYKKANADKDKLISSTKSLNIEFINSDNAAKTGDWTNGTWTPSNGTHSYNFISSSIGNSLEFAFEGDVFAIEQDLSKNSAAYEVYIDGVKRGTIDAYNASAVHQMVLGYSNFDLEYGKHNVRLDIVQSSTHKTNTTVGFYDIIIGSTNNSTPVFYGEVKKYSTILEAEMPDSSSNDPADTSQYLYHRYMRPSASNGSVIGITGLQWGEWSIDLDNAGTYSFKIFETTSENATGHLYIDGECVAKSVSMINTGTYEFNNGKSEFTEMYTGALSKGRHTIKYVQGVAGITFDYIKIEEQ